MASSSLTIAFFIVSSLVTRESFSARIPYPSRTARFNKITWALAFVRGAMGIVIFATYPDPHPMAVGILLLCIAYYIGMTVFMTAQAYSAA